MNLKNNPRPDPTRTLRQQRRREKLNKIARDWGYPTWAKFETAIVNGLITYEIRPSTNPP